MEPRWKWSNGTAGGEMDAEREREESDGELREIESERWDGGGEWEYGGEFCICLMDNLFMKKISYNFFLKLKENENIKHE
jgi:hypothetical protein